MVSVQNVAEAMEAELALAKRLGTGLHVHFSTSCEEDDWCMAEYGKLASKTMAGATVLSIGHNPTVIEGDWPATQTVLLEFDSVDAAKEWYYSDAYQEAVKLRQAAANCNGVIVSGF